MEFELLLDRWCTVEEDARSAEDEISAAMKQYRAHETLERRRCLMQALEHRARARAAVLAMVLEIERGGLARDPSP